MFWWLYYATNPCKNFSELPLVMWLQGGPGGSSTGFGNFEEIGPLDRDLKPRRTTWLQAASLLFVDNPVGSGFSYVNKSDAYAKDLATVASDMMVLLKTFFDCHKEFQTVPFYIFSESYGGKMAAGIALELYKAIQQGTIKCTFSKQRATYTFLFQNTDGVNFYNILTKSAPVSAMKSSLEFTQSHLVPLCQRHVRHLQSDALSELMNGPIRKKLKIIPEDCSWGGQATNVFMNMERDFMKPVISIVDALLETGLNVTVYNGQLDLIVDTMGQEAWVRKLKWPELPKFNQLKWKALYSDPKSSETSAFVKSYKNLAFYWILRAGHMVPSDQGDMALKMMRMVTQQE
ncbi:PREDICTED: retinoid-inducible serine carboxypeptidase [Propithecus coquereli]|uniref:retinoid-inducible serine carboxypeptidase n=1 Tax=Propithecus coquereli TaxID=379532 RepID=UPI00063F1C6C|nr:PREDICTED: retinoid-inducible serine carboxypeptidase [Propithecus coquereli]